MQGQRGKIGSLGLENGSTSSDAGQSDSLSDYISLNSPSQENPNANMWNVDESSSSSGPIEVNPGYTDPFGPSSDPFDLDDRRLTHKRKAAELNIGQSSSGSSPDPIIPRLGLNINRASSNNPIMENSSRNLRINSSSSGSGSGQQDPLLDNSNNNRESDSYTVQPVLRRNFQTTSRWTRSTASRINRSSSNLVIPGDRNEIDSIFARINSIGGNGGGGGGGSGGGAAASPVGPSSGPSSSYNSRRLSAFLRGSLLSANDLETGGGQNGNLTSSSSSLQDVGIPPVVRQIDGGVLGGPFLSRGMTAGSEGRGRLVSEIRNVLDSMRRGEPLRFEDLMLLDQSAFFGIADIHDRHREMRLDIDNVI